MISVRSTHQIPRHLTFLYKLKQLNIALNYHAHNVFDENSHRDISTLNSQLASYARTKDFHSTWALFLRLHRSHYPLNAYTFTPVLRVCSVMPNPHRGRQVHSLMIKTGTHSGVIPQTALVDMYSKYGVLGDSVKVFEEMRYRDVVSWNALLSGFLRRGMGQEAVGVFRAMVREGVEYSEFTLCSLLKACLELGELRMGKQVHGLVVVMGRDLVVLNTALIDFYSSVGGVEDALKVFYGSSCVGDDVMWNSMVAGCVRNKKYEAAFEVMCGMKPNVVALTSALVACSQNSDLWTGKQIHCVAVRFGFVSDTQLSNVLLDMYAKCGRILSARSLFDRMDRNDVVSWTSMIDAYGNHGHGIEAFELFKKMGEDGNGVLPNSVTFLTTLSACGHSGLVQKGKECFQLAQEKYGLDPGPEHYVCFIDILGRAGQVDEAWSLFHDMIRCGTRPSAAVWAALLNACSLNLDVPRGQVAAKNLLELEPNDPVYYVLLSNFYAAIGKWDFVDELRSIMTNKGIAKGAGSSWVNVAVRHIDSIKLSA